MILHGVMVSAADVEVTGYALFMLACVLFVAAKLWERRKR